MSKEESMEESMTINFSKLEKFSKKINEASDELTKAITAINEKLNSLNLGIETHVSDSLKSEIGADDEDGYKRETTWHLGYGKSDDGRWGLLAWGFEERIPSGPNGYQVAEMLAECKHLLLSCPRNLRVAAIEQIPQLIEQLEKEAQQFTESVNQAKELANEL
jgi:hypothetical protein